MIRWGTFFVLMFWLASPAWGVAFALSATFAAGVIVVGYEWHKYRSRTWNDEQE